MSTMLLAGADRGVGPGIAAAFADAGWDVITDGAEPVDAIVAVAVAPELLPGMPEPDSTEITTDAAALLALADSAPERMPNGGALLFVTGTGHFATGGPPPALAAAKGAYVGAARALAVRHGRRGIRVNTITFGLVRTPGVEAYLDGLDPSERETFEALVVERTPLRRMGRPEDVGALCVFLASDRGRAITGVEAVADGGLLQLNKTFSYNPPIGSNA